MTASSERLCQAFVQDAIRAFAFLTRETTFRECTVAGRASGMSTDYSEVVFQFAWGYIRIFYGHMEGELDVRTGLRSAAGDGSSDEMSLDEALAILDENAPPPVDRHYRTQPALAEAVERSAQRCKEALAEYLRDPALFERLFTRQRERRSQAMREAGMRQTKEAARKAWDNKEYQAVIALSREIVNELTPLERRRLRYAETQAKGPGRRDE